MTNTLKSNECDAASREAEAIRRAQEGDAGAFEVLYKMHSRRVYSLCLRMVKNTAEAEDLTQQAFLRLFQKIGTFRGDSSFSTWLHRVAVNVVLMHLRRAKPPEVPIDAPENADAAENVSHGIWSGNTMIRSGIQRLNIMRAIRKLPAGYKQMFLLHDVIGYKHIEIAELLGCTMGSSKSQLHKARKRMRDLLQGKRSRAAAEVATAEVATA